jgi:hypothetical protein
MRSFLVGTAAPGAMRRKGLAVLWLLCLMASAGAREWSSPSQAHLLVTVVDENGRPIPGARVILEHAQGGVLREAETDQAGRSAFHDLAAGTYRLRVTKERFYAVTVSDVRLPEDATVEIVLPRRHELVEIVEVTPSTPMLDPGRTTAGATLSAPEILALPTPVMRDLRYALALLPNVVQDASGNLHIAGSAETQTCAMLDGFMVTHPLTGLFDLRVSVDAIREAQIHSSRYSAEYGRGSGGVLDLTTPMGDDRFRFSATDVIPSVQSRKGVHLNNWTPRATLSGPLRKKRAWFYDAFEGEYDLTIVEELPRGADRNRVWRWSTLAKAQANVAPTHLLTFTVLLNRFRSPYDGLSRFVPRETTRRIVRGADFVAVKGQTYRPDGLSLDYGMALAWFRRAEHPWGEGPYLLFPDGPRGSFFRTREDRAHRWQGIANLTLPAVGRRGRHDVRIGVDWTHLGARERAERRPIFVFREDGTRARTVQFAAASDARVTNIEIGIYGQDRWSFSSRGVLELGLRWDWDSALGAARWSPRAAASYLLTADRRTKLVGGIGLFHEATPLEMLVRPRAGRRWDVFHAADAPAEGIAVETIFRANARALAPPRALIWSAGLERQLAATLSLSFEFVQKRGYRGWVYVPLAASAAVVSSREEAFPFGPSTATVRLLELRDVKRDRYDAVHWTLRWTPRESASLFASYARSRARSTAVLDFAVDALLFGPQAGGPLPWDTPNRFLLWGGMPLPKRFSLAYALEWRDGYPFLVVNGEQRLVEPPNRRRLPAYFSLNLHIERRFHLFGLQWELRAGLNNATNHPNATTVNNNVDSSQFLALGGIQRRAFIGRLRVLGRK